LPFVVGIFERQLPRLTAELGRDVRLYLDEGFGAALHTKKTTQMRTVPVNANLTPDRGVATYDDVRALIRGSEGPFAAMECICRKGRALVGEPCSQTTRRDTCLTFGQAADYMVEAGAARFVSRDEMLELLDEADRDGLVLQPENTRHPLFVCCCCGCCCGVLTTAKRLPEPAEYFSTNYYAEVDTVTCEACGTCQSRCQMDAVSLDSGRAVVSRSHCIGCGLCLTTCQSGSISLRRTDRERVPPKNTASLYVQLYRERYGTLGLATAMARHALGMKA
jgi:ferredoxin